MTSLQDIKNDVDAIQNDAHAKHNPNVDEIDSQYYADPIKNDEDLTSNEIKFGNTLNVNTNDEELLNDKSNAQKDIRSSIDKDLDDNLTKSEMDLSGEAIKKRIINTELLLTGCQGFLENSKKKNTFE